MAGIIQTSGAAPAIPAPPRAPRHPLKEFAINPRHVGVLLWLRWKLGLRALTRGSRRNVAMQIIGLVFTVIFVLGASAAVGIFTTLGYVYFDRPQATQLLFGVLGALYIIWALLPLFQYSVNEGLDVTKLTIYPLTRGEQMVSLTLATLFDPGSLVLLAADVAVLIGWHASALAIVITVAALVLLYAHTVGLSQLALAALMGLLRSRRYRDLSIIVFALIGSSCYFIQVVAGEIFSNFDFTSLQRLHLETYLQWIPPGMAAQAISQADQGAFVPALIWLAALAALTPVLLTVWAVVLDHGVTTAEGGGAGSARRRRGRARAEAGTAVIGATGATGARDIAAAHSARGWRPLSSAALAITQKDLRYFWRDPQIKASVLSSGVLMLIVLVSNLSGHGSDATNGFSIVNFPGVLVAPWPSLVIVLALAQNTFGLERQGLQMLFLFPVRALDIFWGKNLAVGIVAFGSQVALTLIVAAVTGEWVYVLPALALGLTATLIMLGCGNLSSVLAPFRVRSMRMGENNLSTENGCLRSVISMGVSLATTLLLLPILAALIPLFIGQPFWLVVSLPLLLIYGIAFYQISTRLIAPRLFSRAPELLASTVREA